MYLPLRFYFTLPGVVVICPPANGPRVVRPLGLDKRHLPAKTIMSLFRRENLDSLRFQPLRILPFTWRQRRRLIKSAAIPAQAYSFPFNLSSRPPAKWVEFFQTAWYQQQGCAEIPRLEGRTVM